MSHDHPIQVMLFAGAEAAVGKSRIVLGLSAPAAIEQIAAQMLQEYPALSGLLPRSRFAVNNQFVNNDHVVKSGDDIALIPPVSGG